MSPQDLSPIATLLHRVITLPKQPSREPTFLEVTGYPHLENVSSNILAFYLNPNKPHGMGNVILHALNEALLLPPLNTTTVNIRREESTNESKRIDIFIETDELVIGIENKIYHSLDNNLTNYWRHIRTLAKGRKCVGVVLSLNKIQRLHDTNFQQITYEQFFSITQRLLSNVNTTNRYLVFWQEFVQTIRNLVRGTDMDTDKLKFFQEHRKEIGVLLAEIAILRRDMLQKLNQLASALQLEQKASGIKRGYWSNPNAAMEFMFYGIELSPENALQIDIFVDLAGWHMQFWNRRGDRDTVLYIIDQQGIPYYLNQKPWRIVYKGDSPAYDADIDELHQWATVIISKLIPITK